MTARIARCSGMPRADTADATMRSDDTTRDANDTGDADDASTPSERSSEASPRGDKRKGHGRLPVSMYQAATHIAVAHASLRVGGACPHCRFGKLYDLKVPAQFLPIFGQPMLTGTCWDCQRLRCSNCGQVHTAKAPAEAQGPKFDESAVAMTAFCRYSLGLPHNRLERMQKYMKLPVPASTQSDVLAGA